MKVTRSFLVMAVILCLGKFATFPGIAGDAGKAVEMEKEILRLEEVGRQKFLKGDPHWDDLMADGAYMVRWDGAAVVYQAGQTLPAAPMKSMVQSEMIARAYGDVVVVTGLGEGEGEMADKKPFSFKSRFLNVWQMVDGKWKIVVTQNTVVRQQPPK